MKVLIAEDDKFLANAYRVKLEKSGFSISVASDGVAALEMVQEDKPDVIVLDLMMPKKDGFTVLEELKKSPDTKDIPVVVASNLGQKEDIDRATSLGASGYIIKTDLSLNTLVDQLTALAS